MSIQPLPTSTVQQLRCSMNLTSPSDFIKELIDNAVDANATAIEITVSSNTLDRIAVKDNGSGIDIDDFNSLGRRAHTSKLRAFEELASIGGKSLGFRGEALASANALANIVIITKKSRDPIAWRIELTHGVGGVQAKRPVSATAGTTVAATQLFENMLPRQKSLLKEKSKTMSKIQGILKAYALARPHIKWSLKVVGDSKPVWSYSPASGASGREAILQLFGANLMERCIEISERTPESPLPDTEGHSSKSTGGWIFSGYYGLQPSTSNSRQGVFISIDGRPMSSSWHISKKIVNIVKSHVTNIKESDNFSSMSTTHLFVQLSIHCPPMTYDPNIAARKDEVLLADEKSFLGKLEAILRKSVVQKPQCQPPTPLLSERKTSGVTPQCEESHKCQPAQGTDNGEADISRQTNENDKTKNHIAARRNSIDHHSKKPSASSRRTIRAIVNTSFTVNMSIKEDAESPNGTSLDTIEVEVPRRPSPVQVDDPVRKDHIRHYFHPVPNQDFEIACDDTATTAQTKEPKDKRRSPDSHPSKRVPLQPLTASDLNRIREEEVDYGPEQVESRDPRLVRTAMNAESAIVSPPSQTANDGTRPLSRPGESGTRFQPPPVPFRGAQDNQLFVGHSRMVLTPPPSDPRHRDDGDSPLLRPRLRLFDASPTPANIADRFDYRHATLAAIADADSPGRRSEELWSRDIGSTGDQDRFAVPWLRSEGSSTSPRGDRRREDVTRAREPCHEESERRGRGPTGQQGQFVVPWLRDESNGKSSHGGRRSEDVTHTLANKDYPTLLGRPADKRPREKQALVSLQSSPFAEALEESSMTKKATPSPEFGGRPQIYSHASQIALARTPAPMQRFSAAASGVMSRQTGVEFRSPSTHRQMTDDAEWPGLRKADGSCPSQAGFCERISAGSCGSLDSEPTDRRFVHEGEVSTQRLATTISTGHDDIERLSSQHAKVGQYELPGDIVVSLLGANLGGVQSVQRRLRWCVDSWMQQNKMQGQVDYEM
ncbi:hypothetical protein E4U56_005083 [Claviceps arundinis]|uniref:DNA mismatch repair protein S5 domain-containing protein n=1 Tax=Claviceps arundinis TaxID=1623583 RepID=A0A9P7SKV0_9HYPO|nr:hypothetical protein E4U56_005083 [Claviceps arundinis]